MDNSVMKISLIILAFTIFNCNISAQSYSPWKIGFYFAPEYQYRTVVAMGEGFPKDIILPDRDSTEIPIISFNTGIPLQYYFRKSLSIKSGLFYSERGYQQRKIPVCRPGPPPNCSTIFIGKHNNVEFAHSAYKFGYISIPALIQYDHNFGKFNIGAFGGLSLDYLAYVRRKTTEYVPGNLVESYNVIMKLSTVNKFIYTYVVGVNLEKQLFPKINLALEPTFRYSSPIFKSAKDGEGLQTNLYSFGLGFNLKYNLVKS